MKFKDIVVGDFIRANYRISQNGSIYCYSWTQFNSIVDCYVNGVNYHDARGLHRYTNTVEGLVLGFRDFSYTSFKNRSVFVLLYDLNMITELNPVAWDFEMISSFEKCVPMV